MRNPLVRRTAAVATFVAAALATIAGAASAGDAAAVSVSIPMHLVDAQGGKQPVGTIAASDTAYGLLLTPDLAGLPPGVHGFHVHEKPSCDPGDKDGQKVAALAAGGHYDPAATGRHEGPYGSGHLGDLPAVYVGPDGKASYPVLAPRLKTADLAGRSLMIHAGGDNHADHPAPLGGGGPRLACGVVPAAK